MFILRIIFTLAVIWLVFYVYRRFFKKVPRLQQTREEEITKEIVRCQHCGLHVPKTEAIKRQNAYYCCQDHAESE